MVTGVDFLPAEYWKRRASQRDQYVLLAIVIGIILLLVASIGHESHKASLVRSQLTSVEGDYKDALEQAAEVKRMEDRRAPMAFDAKLYSLLRAHPSFSRALVAVATSCPSHVTLGNVSIRGTTAPASDSRKNPTRASSDSTPRSTEELRTEQLARFTRDREQTRLLLHIEGTSNASPDVVEFVKRLERSECFANITFSVSEASSARNLDLQRFTIQCWLTKVL